MTSNTKTGVKDTEGRKVGHGKKDKNARNDGRDQKRQKTKHKSKDFKGETADMNGHVFQTFSKANDRMQFNKTVKALGHYINRNLKHPGDLVQLYKRIEQPVLTPSDNITDKEFANKRQAWSWKEDMRRHKDHKIVLQNNLCLLYTVIWGQCSETMKAKLEGLQDFETQDIDCNCIWLLQSIQSTMYLFEGKKNLFVAMTEVRAKLETCSQRQGQDLTKFFHKFKETVDAFEHYGGSLGLDHRLINLLVNEDNEDYPGEPPEYDAEDSELAFDEALAYHTDMGQYRRGLEAVLRDKILAIMFIQRVERGKYLHLLRELHNEYTRRSDHYPSDLASAYTMVDTFVPPKSTSKPLKRKNDKKQDKSVEPDLGPEPTNPAFLQVTDGNATDIDLTENFSALQITDKIDTLQSNTDYIASGFIFYQTIAPLWAIPRTWILLDSQSTVSIFNNKDFLTNIRESQTPCNLWSNGGGKERITQVGDLTNFSTIWYSPHSLANILALADMRRQNRVTMDTAVEPAIIVHRKNGTEMKFKEFHLGLYYYDVTKAKNNSTNVTPYCLVQTVENNKSLFHRREIEAADKARELYVKLGRPSQKHFEFLLRNKLITDCPLTADNAKRAVEIYGPDIGALNGKMKNRKAAHVPSITPISAPDLIFKHHQYITLSINIFYIQGIPFLHTISRKIQFRTAMYLPDRRKGTILQHLRVVLSLYTDRGFIIRDIHADLEFACMRQDLAGINLNIVPQDEHVPEIERSTETIKECFRATIHGLPYARYPKAGIVQLVTTTIRSLNQIPAEKGISDCISPGTLILGIDSLDFKKLLLSFGQYAQVFNSNMPTNTQKSRGTPAIAMSISPNENGYYFFLNLETAQIISCRKFVPLPLSNAAIARFEAIAEAENQPLIPNGCPTFEWAPGIEIADLDEISVASNDTLDHPDDLSDVDHDEQSTDYPSDARSLSSDNTDDASVASTSALVSTFVDSLPPLINPLNTNDDISISSDESSSSTPGRTPCSTNLPPEAVNNVSDLATIEPIPDNTVDPANDLPNADQRSNPPSPNAMSKTDTSAILSRDQRSKKTKYNLRPRPRQRTFYSPHQYDTRLNFLMTAEKKTKTLQHPPFTSLGRCLL